jgi:hypothetical protein
MDPKVSALERAFQLARSGQAASIDDIKKRLKREGYEEKAVDGGPSLAGQLRKLINEASERKGGPKVAPLALLHDRLSPPSAASAVAAAGPTRSRFRRCSRGGSRKARMPARVVAAMHVTVFCKGRQVDEVRHSEDPRGSFAAQRRKRRTDATGKNH